MKKKNFLLLCFLLIAIGCDYNSKPRLSFNGNFVDDKTFDTVKLEMQPCQLDISPLAPWSCCLLDSLLVVGENFNKVTNNFFKVYNKNKLVLEFGMIGNGLNDYITPFLTSKGKAEQHYFYIADGSKFSEIAIDTVNHQAQHHNLPMPDDFISINNVLMYSDSSIVVTQTGDFQLQHYDRKIQSVVGYNYFEDAGFLTKIDNFNLTMQLYKSVSSSNNQYAVIAYHYFKTIDIISLSDMSLYRRICFRNYDCNEYTIDDRGNITFDDDNVTNFFTYITASKDKFYALCWDCTGEEASTGKVRSSIYEIDYSGTIIKKYQPNVTITSFAINGKEIYAIVLDHKQHEKIMYKGVLD